MSTYTVEAGDTLGKIAQKFGTTVAVLSDLNGISNPDLIRVGQVLQLPGAGAGGGDGASSGAGGAGRFRMTEGGVRLREAPGRSARILVEDLGLGTIVEARGGEIVELDGFRWTPVRFDGMAGFVADQFLGPALPRPGVFKADCPTVLQQKDWTCSICSTMWLLRSIGVNISAEEAESKMSPRYVSEADGLLDASGAGIVRFLADEYQVPAANHPQVSFDEVASWAGNQPVTIGGRHWAFVNEQRVGHWVNVRGVNNAGELVLANPGGTGPKFGQQTLGRAEFQSKGPFSAVRVTV